MRLQTYSSGRRRIQRAVVGLTRLIATELDDVGKTALRRPDFFGKPLLDLVPSRGTRTVSITWVGAWFLSRCPSSCRMMCSRCSGLVAFSQNTYSAAGVDSHTPHGPTGADLGNRWVGRPRRALTVSAN